MSVTVVLRLKRLTLPLELLNRGELPDVEKDNGEVKVNELLLLRRLSVRVPALNVDGVDTVRKGSSSLNSYR
ncbi:4863_t:CDS:2 [Acaulospora colombiana]|uniref:4863_t:CDS:1 n=1 Tax=Acaulospora colombiana TaxID=27376 RepID=A0ACA9KCI0_9GLOM|nr:4863_t:CDS:2 [Acaulospora colombiana]